MNEISNRPWCSSDALYCLFHRPSKLFCSNFLVISDIQFLFVNLAYIMRPSRRVIPTDILSHIQSCSRLEDLYVDTIPDSEDAVYELIIDGVACNILLDLSVSYYSGLGKSHGCFSGNMSPPMCCFREVKIKFICVCL